MTKQDGSDNTLKGFTLVELIIVVGIIAILAAVAIPAYRGYITRAKETSASNVLEQFSILLETYRAENGGFPPTATYSYTESATGTDTSTAPTIISVLPDFQPRSSTQDTTEGILFDYSLVITGAGTVAEAATFTATGVREGAGISANGTYQ